MINRKSTFFLGIFVFIIPFLGIPSSWRTFFIVVSGIILIILSVKITLPKKISKSRISRREKVTPVFVESMPLAKDRMDGVIPPVSNNESTEDLSVIK